jgi:hypothetical protein
MPLQTWPTSTTPTRLEDLPVTAGRAARAVALPLLAGALLGPLDVALKHVLPAPFGHLLNSSPVWALVAFVVGFAVRTRHRWWPAVAGTLTLLLAVETYYLAYVLLRDRDPVVLVDDHAVGWLVVGVGAGVVFGTAGAWARSGHPWRGPVGTATAAGLLLTGAWVELSRFAEAPVGVEVAYRHDSVQAALVLLVLAGVTGVLAARSARQRVLGLVLAVPVAVGGLALARVLGMA